MITKVNPDGHISLDVYKRQRQGLTVMNDNFVTYGTANVMVSNITYDTALEIQEQLADIDGVTTVDFDDTDEHYTNASALFSVSFDLSLIHISLSPSPRATLPRLLRLQALRRSVTTI